MTIEKLGDMQIAYMRRTGGYGEGNRQLMEQFKRYLREHALLQEDTTILGIALDDPAQIDTLVTGRKGFLADTAGATMVLLKDNCQERAADATISFHTSPQPQFNKKFELLADDIRDNREKGYTTCLLTENKAQIERLRNIFNSMGERDVPFEAVGVTLHAGFIDHASRSPISSGHKAN